MDLSFDMVPENAKVEKDGENKFTVTKMGKDEFDCSVGSTVIKPQGVFSATITIIDDCTNLAVGFHQRSNFTTTGDAYAKNKKGKYLHLFSSKLYGEDISMLGEKTFLGTFNRPGNQVMLKLDFNQGKIVFEAIKRDSLFFGDEPVDTYQLDFEKNAEWILAFDLFNENSKFNVEISQN